MGSMGPAINFGGGDDRVTIASGKDFKSITVATAYCSTGTMTNVTARVFESPCFLLSHSNSGAFGLNDESVALSVLTSGTSGTFNTGTATAPRNQVNHILASWTEGAVGNIPDIYIQGRKRSTTNTIGTGTRNSMAGTWSLGNRSTNDRDLVGWIEYLRIAARPAFNGEAEELFRNPWCVYESPVSVYGWKAPASSGKSITGAQTLSLPTQAGSLVITRKITGAQTLSLPTQAGALNNEHKITGAQTLSLPSQSGALANGKTIIGAQTLSLPTQAGSLVITRKITGAQTLLLPIQNGIIDAGVDDVVGSGQLERRRRRIYGRR